ncbi:hypothetical protein LSH36_48g00033 [Paralvinella palmiformis]|uniref:PWWP domain-containing protein n=1 Tax=Paralvinella palmiformis TaxID=53620 RepID=A0AAD9K6X9_9ANNE|nr:hypothetical protein LSH36_48g00033 [Paralvinella palmiformis]
MATFKTGDLVWAKMKGFPAWPGKLIDPKNDKKTEKRPKNKHFVFFYGSENYAWIPEEQIWSYMTHKDKFILTNRVPRGFKEAVESIEDAFRSLPPSQREEQAKNKSGLDSGEKKLRDTPRVSPKVAKRRSSTQGSGGKDTPQIKRSRLQGKSPLTPQSRRSGEGLTNSARVISVKPTVNHEKAASSTIPTSVSPTSTTTPKKSLDGCDSWSTSFSSFKKDSPLFERTYDRMLEPSMVEPILSKSIIPTPLKIGFLGLGIMGSGMVSNLLKSGHEVTVWNRTPSKVSQMFGYQSGLVVPVQLLPITLAAILHSCTCTYTHNYPQNREC